MPDSRLALATTTKKEGSGSSELWAGARRRRRECKREPDNQILLACLASWWGRDARESDKRLSSPSLPSLAEPMAMRFGDSVAWLVVERCTVRVAVEPDAEHLGHNLVVGGSAGPWAGPSRFSSGLRIRGRAI